MWTVRWGRAQTTPGECEGAQDTQYESPGRSTTADNTYAFSPGHAPGLATEAYSDLDGLHRVYQVPFDNGAGLVDSNVPTDMYTCVEPAAPAPPHANSYSDLAWSHRVHHQELGLGFKGGQHQNGCHVSMSGDE